MKWTEGLGSHFDLRGFFSWSWLAFQGNKNITALFKSNKKLLQENYEVLRSTNPGKEEVCRCPVH